MTKTTIVIPARNELYLNETVDDIFLKAAGDIEVLIVLDDCWNLPLPADRPNMTILHWGGRRGLRAAINAAVEIGKGDYLMKVDAHCLFDEGFDEKLKEDCDSDWVVIPRRYSLEPDGWKIRENNKVVDYEYLTYPYSDEAIKPVLCGTWWQDRGRKRRDILIDETMTFQGSSWFTPMKYFKELVYPMDIEHYGSFVCEAQEIGLKAWLSGGKCMVNKKTWYAHLWKGQDYRNKYLEKMGIPYSRIGHSEFSKGNEFTADYWMNNKWEKRIHDLSWLIEKFWPVPTWPEDRSLWTH